MTRKLTIAAVLLSTMLIACSKPAGNEFVGKWEGIKRPYTLEFAKNGDSFLMIQDKEKYPASLQQDNTLQASTPFGSMVFAYSKGSDTIISMGDEYKRVKP